MGHNEAVSTAVREDIPHVHDEGETGPAIAEEA